MDELLLVLTFAPPTPAESQDKMPLLLCASSASHLAPHTWPLTLGPVHLSTGCRVERGYKKGGQGLEAQGCELGAAGGRCCAHHPALMQSSSISGQHGDPLAIALPRFGALKLLLTAYLASVKPMLGLGDSRQAKTA